MNSLQHSDSITLSPLNPKTAAYTKSKPRVRAYLLEHTAAVRQQFVEQDADLSRIAVERAVDQQNQLSQNRERLLARLWEIADLTSEITRGNMSSQVRALSLIAAVEGHIPDRRAASAQNKPAPPPTPDIYAAAWLREQQENGVPPADPAQQEAAPEPQSPPGSADAPPPLSNPTVDLTPSTDSASPSSPSPRASSVPRVPMADNFAPDTRIPFSIKRNPFARRR